MRGSSGLKCNDSAGYGPFGAHTFSTYIALGCQSFDSPDPLAAGVRDRAVRFDADDDLPVLAR